MLESREALEDSTPVCPLCEDDGDAREAIAEREGVLLCVWHVLAYDLDQGDMRDRVRAAA
jgi:nitrite reductase/ring-hydroxylating ferredoxin subunit